MGGALASLVAAVKDRERQRADVLARLEHLDGLSREPESNDGIRAKLCALLTKWRDLLGSEPVVARQILRKLLDGRLVLEPDLQNRRFLLHGRVALRHLLETLGRVGGLVPPG